MAPSPGDPKQQHQQQPGRKSPSSTQGDPAPDVKPPHGPPPPATQSASSIPTASSTASKLPKTALSKKPQLTSSSSATNSPRASRENSPVRPRTRSIGSSKTSSPRRDSQDASPARSKTKTSAEGSGTSTPSGIRKISLGSTPNLPSTTPSSNTRPRQVLKDALDEGARQRATSPRVKSPPPSANSKVATPTGKSQESSSAPQTPNIVIQSSTPSESSSALSTPSAARSSAVEEQHSQPLPSGVRTPIRGTGGHSSTLETVQEGSLPSTPAIGVKSLLSSSPNESKSDTALDLHIDDSTTKEVRKVVVESGKESSGTKSDGPTKKPSTSNMAKPPTISRSSTSLASKTIAALSSRGKSTAEPSGNNMTVETETVSSIPQVALGGGGPSDRGMPRSDAGGIVRPKPSSETIKPKKDKKKTVRKAPSLNSGTASSRADIFEAKVASAVDEADSSDSDETFVYESNPPESHAGRTGRFHSRTSSVTSMQSYGDHRGGLRSANATSDGGQAAIPPKKSMKFANPNPSYSSSGVDGNVSDRVDVPHGHAPGSARGNATGVHSQKRMGRGGRAGHASLFDSDSPFSNKNRATTGRQSRHSSRPTSPRLGNQRFGAIGKATNFTSYDMDIEGDDERVPLISPLRSTRGRNNRRYGEPQQRHKMQQKQRGIFTRYMACLLTSVAITLILVGALAFVIATTKPLADVKLCKIDNVLASEQQIILDLVVQATNPNILTIAVSDMDVNIFAKSSYVGSETLRQPGSQTPQARRDRRLAASNETSDADKAHSKEWWWDHHGIDEGTDPPDEEWPGRDSETMLLGEIYTLDSALIFPASPFRHKSFISSGELKLRRPGNRTEVGGSKRWERVLQHHFNLIVRGVIKYQIPFSGKTYSSAIRGNVTIDPDGPVDDDMTSPSMGSVSKCVRMDGSELVVGGSPAKKKALPLFRFARSVAGI